MLEDLTDRVAVVTGAASGIGAALTRRLAAEGMTVVAADIDADRLDAVVASVGDASGTGRAVPVAVDVADRVEMERLAEAAFGVVGHVDLLCLNAGVFQGGQVWEPSTADWDWVLGVNLLGVIHGIATFVPAMTAQGTDGHVVVTSSVAAFVSAPFSAPYIVSKAGSFAGAECLAHDLAAAGSRIGASVLVPSAVDTGIAHTARVRPTRYGTDATGSGPMTVGFLAELTANGLDPDAVVDPVLDAVRTGTFLIPTRSSWAEQIRGRADHLLARDLPTGLPLD